MNPWKPWFVFRPSQVVRRLTFRPTSTYRHLPVAWGERLLALDDEHIGRCLGTTGIYDLAVSELLFRLIHPGDLVIDAGANIGYMSVLAAMAGAKAPKVRHERWTSITRSSAPIEGDNVREAISNVSTPHLRDPNNDDASDKPDSNVTITSASVFNDLQNKVLLLKAANVPVARPTLP